MHSLLKHKRLLLSITTPHQLQVCKHVANTEDVLHAHNSAHDIAHVYKSDSLFTTMQAVCSSPHDFSTTTVKNSLNADVQRSDKGLTSQVYYCHTPTTAWRTVQGTIYDALCICSIMNIHVVTSSTCPKGMAVAMLQYVTSLITCVINVRGVRNCYIVECHAYAPAACFSCAMMLQCLTISQLCYKCNHILHCTTGWYINIAMAACCCKIGWQIVILTLSTHSTCMNTIISVYRAVQLNFCDTLHPALAAKCSYEMTLQLVIFSSLTCPTCTHNQAIHGSEAAGTSSESTTWGKGKDQERQQRHGPHNTDHKHVVTPYLNRIFNLQHNTCCISPWHQCLACMCFIACFITYYCRMVIPLVTIYVCSIYMNVATVGLLYHTTCCILVIIPGQTHVKLLCCHTMHLITSATLLCQYAYDIIYCCCHTTDYTPCWYIFSTILCKYILANTTTGIPAHKCVKQIYYYNKYLITPATLCYKYACDITHCCYHTVAHTPGRYICYILLQMYIIAHEHTTHKYTLTFLCSYVEKYTPLFRNMYRYSLAFQCAHTRDYTLLLRVYYSIYYTATTDTNQHNTLATRNYSVTKPLNLTDTQYTLSTADIDTVQTETRSNNSQINYTHTGNARHETYNNINQTNNTHPEINYNKQNHKWQSENQDYTTQSRQVRYRNKINDIKIKISLQLRQLLLLLLMLAGDVETNPGPFTCEQVDEYMSMTEIEALTHIYTLHNMLQDIKNHQNQVQERTQRYQQLQTKAKNILKNLPCLQPLPVLTYSQDKQDPRTYNYPETHFAHLGIPSTHYTPGPRQTIMGINVQGDGNCMFNSLAFLFFGTEYGNAQIRLRVALCHILYTPAHTQDTHGRSPYYITMNLNDHLCITTPGAYTDYKFLHHVAAIWNIHTYISHPGPREYGVGAQLTIHYTPEKLSQPLYKGVQNTHLPHQSIFITWTAYNYQGCPNYARDMHMHCNHFVPLITTTDSSTHLLRDSEAWYPHHWSNATYQTIRTTNNTLLGHPNAHPLTPRPPPLDHPRGMEGIHEHETIDITMDEWSTQGTKNTKRAASHNQAQKTLPITTANRWEALYHTDVNMDPVEQAQKTIGITKEPNPEQATPMEAMDSTTPPPHTHTSGGSTVGPQGDKESPPTGTYKDRKGDKVNKTTPIQHHLLPQTTPHQTHPHGIPPQALQKEGPP